MSRYRAANPYPRTKAGLVVAYLAQAQEYARNLIAAIGIAMMLFAFVLSYRSDRPNFPENLSTGGLTCPPGNATLCAENVKSAAEKAWKGSAPERRKACASSPDYQELFLCLARL